jgi:MEMO1 family protein
MVFQLSDDEKRALLALARQTIETYVEKRSIPPINPKMLSASLNRNCGAFVTLHKLKELRGCIGRFDTGEPLYKIVQHMAIAAATQDYRFAPVQKKEMKSITIEISVLTPLQPITSPDEIELGRHGIYIRKKMNTGTFLPQVAIETGWTTEEFLGHCAQDKMSIGWNGWKDAELFTYEALVFSE